MNAGVATFRGVQIRGGSLYVYPPGRVLRSAAGHLAPVLGRGSHGIVVESCGGGWDGGLDGSC